MHYPHNHRNHDTTAVITCFSYAGNHEYIFNPLHLQTDLRRILRFVLMVSRCKFQNIYILTDLVPSEEQRLALIARLELLLERYLRQRGYRERIISYQEYYERPCPSRGSSKFKDSFPSGQSLKIKDSFSASRGSFKESFSPEQSLKIKESSYQKNVLIDWFKSIAKKVGHYFKESPSSWYSRIIHQLMPEMWSTSVVEFASLLTNFIIVNGSLDYDARLRVILNPSSSSGSRSLKERNLIFYYTGHGIRHLSYHGNVDVVKDICLPIPTVSKTTELYSRMSLRKVIQLWPGRAFIVFDCCRAESIIEYPFKLTFNKFGQTMDLTSTIVDDKPETIYLASTRQGQTCGFCTGVDEYGSVFTYHLMAFLERIYVNSLNVSREGKNASKDLREDKGKDLQENRDGSKESRGEVRGREFSDLYTAVEEKIQHYRARSKNPPQNMLVQLNQRSIKEFPLWLFGRA